MRRTYARRLAAAVVAFGVLAGPAHGSELRLTAGDVPGMRSAGAKGAALNALGGKPSRAVRRAARSGMAFTAAKRRLTIGLFTLRSTAAAKRVAPGRRTRTSIAGGKAQAVVTLRVGRVVAAIRYALPGRSTKRAAAVAGAFATSQAAKLRRLLNQTAWQRTLDEIRRDGTFSTGTALRAFAIAYGPLPGVKRPRGRLGVEAGTAAIRMIARKWSSLTAAQQQAVERALGIRFSGAHKASPRARAADNALTPAPEYQAIVDQHLAFFKAKLPTAAVLPIKIFKAAEEIKHPKDPSLNVLADALVVNTAGQTGSGTPAYCRVRVPPKGQATAGTPNFSFLIAHEVFHCVQFALIPAWSGRPDWIIEGLAEWAAIEATAWPLSLGMGWPHQKYLSSPADPLFGRSYDASGFWARTNELNVLWERIPLVLGAPASADAFAAAGATQQEFVDTWPSATMRFPYAGDAWYQQQPWAIAHEQYPTTATPIVHDAALETEPFAMRPYAVLMDPERPLVQAIGISGSLRAGTPKQDFGKVDSQWYCQGTCTCPPGQSGSVPKHEQLSDGLYLGLTGGHAAGTGQVSFHSLDEFCGVKSGVSVSGATNYTISQPAFCVVTPGRMVVEIAWNANGQKQAHITIEIAGYSGKGVYGPSQTTVTAYDYRSSSLQHQWGPGPGSAAVSDAGTNGFGAKGTVNATLSFPGEPPSQVVVDGSWSCTRNDGKQPPT